MKEKWKEFLKFWASFYIPVYGSIMYIFLFYFSYWYAWALTNTVFVLLTYPFQRRYIFKTSDVCETKNKS